MPILGLGCGPIGEHEVAEADAARLIDRALERGVDLFDTARSYGLSEERLGTILAHRRDRIVLSTKVGYGVEGHSDWTGPCVAAGIERALGTLRTDRIDIVHLHSCDRSVLQREDVLRALEDGVRAGKVRVAAYSGEESDLEHALSTSSFGAVQLSVSPWDQRSLRTRVPLMRARAIGVLAKRSLANAPWRFAQRPGAEDLGAYWDRFHTLDLDAGGLSFFELALRFTAHAEGIGCALLGTRSSAHLDAAIDAVLRGPLEPARLAHIDERWRARGSEMPGIV